ncbi:MAG: hypothetical protein J5J06_00820 [Phycisphaerae bacterium]|nr:hypothetical protein [Phycisphaerae bacterium]
MNRRLFGGIAAVGLLVWGGFYVYDEARPRVVSANATITAIDVPARTASVQFIHPRSGRKMTVSGDVAPDCEIMVAGKPAKLSDVPVGSIAKVTAIRHAEGGATATHIIVEDKPRTTPAEDPEAASSPGTPTHSGGNS